jgi:hypothetical protein
MELFGNASFEDAQFTAAPLEVILNFSEIAAHLVSSLAASAVCPSSRSIRA